MQQATNKEHDKEKSLEKSSPKKTAAALRVRCNGGAQASGHPVVYLSLNEEGFVVCPYCSQRFGKSP